MKLKVLVVGKDSKIRESLVETLCKNGKIDQAYQADRLDAAFVLAKEADLLLLVNPIPPEFDGIAFLKSLIKDDIRPGAFVISSLFSAGLIGDFSFHGVARCMSTPINHSVLMRNIEEWHNGLQERIGGKSLRLKKQISDILFDIGMMPISGYYDCCTSIEWLCCHGNSRGCITKELYPYLARSTRQTPIRVERNIRYVIGRTWDQADCAVLEKYFGTAMVQNAKSHPSNMEFLCALAEYIRRNTDLLEKNLF